ncbi:MAG: hypothetical protein ACHP9Z_08260 [Streptosporangiales bacterium]
MNPPSARQRVAAAAAGLLTAAGFLAVSAATASAATASAGTGTAAVRASAPQAALRVQQILSGKRLRHFFPVPGSSRAHSEALTNPDDLTSLGRYLFTAFQNGVGPQGQASPDGNRYSTIVQLRPDGHPLRQWDILGKCDGLTADPATRRIIATVNEDAHSSVYTIAPLAPAGEQVQHFRYSVPLPSKGGTDAISVYRGQVLISASAPGTTGAAAPQPGYPAVYQVRFEPAIDVAVVRPLFSDEAKATVANVGSHGKTVRLALTDPDSNAVVPAWARRFAGDFELTSQGDKEQIFSRPGRSSGLQVLRLSQSVDDTAWASTGHGRLYATSTGGDTVDLVTGRFSPGSVLVAVTPCDANGAPATCPGPGFPANYLGSLNPWTGHISRVPVHGAALQPQGLLFLGGPRR